MKQPGVFMNQIYSYLKNSESNGEIIKGVKVLDKHLSRASQLIERLKAFTPENVTYDSLLEPYFVNQKNKEWYMYRNLAIIAITEYIREYPFLMHTPSSLRSIFGMPTRKDRKRGKFSGKELINKALENINNFDELINYESIEELIEQLQEVGTKFPEHQQQCVDLINYLEANLSRNSQEETFIPELSTHSEESLDLAKKFLKNFGFTDVIHEIDQDYPYNGDNKLFTPDLICHKWNELIWFELKEWESFNNFFSPIKQLTNYLEANTDLKISNPKSFVGIIVTQTVLFYQFLKSYENTELSFRELRTAITPRLNEIKTNLDNIHELRNTYLQIGKKMVKNDLRVKAESLYIGLFSEFVNKELGMLNSEYEAGQVFLNTIHSLEKRSDKILILPIDSVQSFKDEPENTFIIFLALMNKHERNN